MHWWFQTSYRKSKSRFRERTSQHGIWISVCEQSLTNKVKAILSALSGARTWFVLSFFLSFHTPVQETACRGIYSWEKSTSRKTTGFKRQKALLFVCGIPYESAPHVPSVSTHSDSSSHHDYSLGKTDPHRYNVNEIIPSCIYYVDISHLRITTKIQDRRGNVLAVHDYIVAEEQLSQSILLQKLPRPTFHAANSSMCDLCLRSLTSSEKPRHSKTITCIHFQWHSSSGIVSCSGLREAALRYSNRIRVLLYVGRSVQAQERTREY
jgi:hypothetical protein